MEEGDGGVGCWVCIFWFIIRKIGLVIFQDFGRCCFTCFGVLGGTSRRNGNVLNRVSFYLVDHRFRNGLSGSI